MIKSFDHLHEAVGEKIKKGKKLKLGAIFPTDSEYIEAINRTFREELIEPYLIGPKAEIQKLTTKYDIIEADGVEKTCRIAFEKAASHEFDLLLKCNIGTRDFIDQLLSNKNEFISRKTTLSHIGVIQSDRYHKLMFVTDGGVTPEPDAAQLINIIQDAAQICRKLGNELPKAGLLAAVEAIYPAIPVTMLEAAIAKMSDRGQIKNVLIDGPLSFDVAISTEVAKSKGITDSKVAGDTDIFALPNMETANGLYKAMAMYANAKTGSIIYGAPFPIASPSAVDSEENIFNSIILGAYLA